jgi:hypothetical protein
MTTMQLDTESLKHLAIHFVGNKNKAETLAVSDQLLELDEDTLNALQSGLLHKFKSIPERYCFHHASSLQYNEVYNYCKQLFESPADLLPLSASIARHLYEASVHPKVKGGELYIAFFEGIPVESRMCKAIGLFKTENKSLFIDVQPDGNHFQLLMKEGVELNKFDKGCLVLHTKEEEGYEVLLFDNQNRGEEAAYWRETFLGLKPQNDSFHHTQHFLSLTKQFITSELDKEGVVDKKEQIELLNKSLDYFRAKESFDIEEFQTEVFADDNVIGSFRDFGSRYIQSNDFDIASNFDISLDAVKKQTRIFKSVVKLDKNFHIYIHGRTDLIEKGVDEQGRKFYKIYYQDEM